MHPSPPSVPAASRGPWGPRRALLTGLLGALTLFLGLATLQTTGDLDPLDHAVDGAVARLGPAVHPLGVALSMPGEWWVVVAAATAAVGWMWWRDQPSLAMWGAGLAMMANTTVRALKPVFGRERPQVGLDLGLGHSFPSGHTIAATASMGCLILLVAQTEILHRHLHGRAARRAWTAAIALTVTAAFVTGLGRVLAREHWLGDVMASWALGATAVCALFLAAGLPRRETSPVPLPSPPGLPPAPSPAPRPAPPAALPPGPSNLATEVPDGMR